MGTVPIQKTMNIIAPNEAPLVIPMMSGDASGLRINPCKISPDTASAAPTKTASSVRGILSVFNTKEFPSPDRLNEAAHRPAE